MTGLALTSSDSQQREKQQITTREITVIIDEGGSGFGSEINPVEGEQQTASEGEEIFIGECGDRDEAFNEEKIKIKGMQSKIIELAHNLRYRCCPLYYLAFGQ